ncbi:fibronectin type III domain-containing protein, partial [Fodinibius salsisoli]|nr:hypothetical protein [Fodinibius salsisoli]
MKYRLLYLLTGIFLLVSLIQCKKSVTQGTDGTNGIDAKPESPIEELSLLEPKAESEQPIAPTFLWKDIAATDSFQIQLSTEKDFATTIVDSIVDTTQFNIQGLPYNSTIYWQVRPVVESTSRDWSDIWNLHTIIKPSNPEPVTTVLQTPDEGAENIPLDVNFQWESVASASRYHLQLAQNKTFENYVVDKEIQGTTYQVTNLDSGKDYYWRVKPISNAHETVWSEVSGFTTKATTPDSLVAPVQLAPDDGAGDVSLTPTFEWEAVAGADAYILHASHGDELVVDQEIKNTTYTPESDLAANADHYWRVRAVKDGNEGKWSETIDFNTTSDGSTNSEVDSLAAPVQLGPNDEAVDVSLQPTFEWEGVEGADAYILHASHGDELVVDQEIKDTTYTPASNLAAESDHYWRVRAMKDGNAGKWSPVISFTTQVQTNDDSTDPEADSLAAPVQLSPDDGAGDVSLTPTFEWEGVEGADAYILHASHGDELVVDQEIKNTTYTPANNLTAESDHYWRVRAMKDGSAGKWSPVTSFTTQVQTNDDSTVPAVTLSSPSDGATNQSTSTTLEWEKLSGINNYKVQLATSSDFFSPIAEETTSATYFEVSGLENNRQYYWRVQATGDNNNSNWSSTWSLTTEDQSIDDNPTGGVASDRAALMDLYKATGGDSWRNNSGWGSGDPSDSWHGIETDANGRVVHIDLFNNGLSGQLPASIGDLTKVRYFNVKKNRLSGSIPSSIGDMASLQWLILQGRTYELAHTLKHPPAYEGTTWNIGYHQG